ncbi:LacI family DNA-binding transcriptional regulator [Pararhizobium haloflavum]|uniref:LacI family DNA-binding transcriptional regulator n=1 Tax=Pararhizobium haloflavum TaxID=2037914 RepID=UPI001FDEEE17|nr:LacI family DNA-binding transcriptional regulator [Pararhizobium haloflavum]
MSPKIVDVARTAGVSTATVSRALTAPGKVSAKTRAIVMAAVEETGYIVNHAARNLRRQQTGGIVVLVPNLSNPFFSQILSGIASVLSGAAFNVLIADTQQPKGADRQIIQYLHNNRADGLIVLDGGLPEHIFGNGDRQARPPAIFACEWIEGSEKLSVTIDNVAGAAMAIDHLVQLGHSRIGHVMGPPDNVLTIRRQEGTTAALERAHLPVRREWYFEGDFSLPSGVRAAKAWLALRDRPDAVFCSSDAMACGFMSELHRHGVRVPDDVSVVGFDDIEIAEHFIPTLTTIHQPRTTIGETAARMLLARINGGEDPVQSIRLPVDLVVRESTSAPRIA